MGSDYIITVWIYLFHGLADATEYATSFNILLGNANLV